MNPTPKAWEFRREISIGDLIAIVTAIAAVLVSYFSLKEQIAIHTQQIATIAVDQDRQDKATDGLRKDVVDSLKDIKQDLRDLRLGQTLSERGERKK